ncbi:UAA transporter [Paraphysoderma sedebokerense]|nr:UAA transporter [Paraphysoderma sedebokerense]
MLEFSFCVAGIYVCFLTWGILQERVSTTPYDPSSPSTSKFRYFLLLNLTQSLTASIVGTIYLYLRRIFSSSSSSSSSKSANSKPGPLLGPTPPSLLKLYLIVALFNSLASPFGYASLQHIDYPTMILGKSCKLVPVMLMSLIIHKRKFPWYQYLSVFLITMGVSGFMLFHDQEVGKGKGNGKNKGKSNSWFGLLLLSINLAFDGLTNSTQDQIFRNYRNEISGTQMMVMMNLSSSLLMFGYLLTPVTSELANAVAFCLTYPPVIVDILLFSLCGALGQVFIFHTLSKFGSLSLVSVTVTRKMFSIVISVLWFGHSVGLSQWACVAVVFGGIGLESLMKMREKQAQVNKALGTKEADVGLIDKGKAKEKVTDSNAEVSSESTATSKRKVRSRTKKAD